MQLTPGSDFGGYEILSTLSEGTWTSVYYARATRPLNRLVTLKVLNESRLANHFIYWAQLNAVLNHDRIPRLHVVSEVDRVLLSARHFVEGTDLARRTGAGAFSLSQVVQMVNEVAEPLDYAAGLGIFHGNVHPKHILKDSDDSHWLIGFGEFPPADNMIFGNPGHLAPEQIEHNTMTAASDVYALAETALWLLDGQPPFGGLPGPEVILAKKQGKLRKPLAEILSNQPRRLVEVFRKALSTEPTARFPMAGDFAKALEAAT